MVRRNFTLSRSLHQISKPPSSRENLSSPTLPFAIEALGKQVSASSLTSHTCSVFRSLSLKVALEPPNVYHHHITPIMDLDIEMGYDPQALPVDGEELAGTNADDILVQQPAQAQYSPFANLKPRSNQMSPKKRAK